MNIVISPDSFKGSFSAIEVGNTIFRAFKEKFPNSNIDVLPMADGGEGTVETLVYATDGKKVEVEVTGPTGKKVRTYYGLLGDHQTVAIEVANTAGLQMVGKSRNPLRVTSYGLGELLLTAINDGYRHFIIGLGGSATNDGGLGMLQAIGVKFFDSNNELLPPYVDSLNNIHSIDISGISPALRECQLTIACDVENILCGENGATYIFGPQKGLSKDQLAVIDQAMERYASLAENEWGKRARDTPGAGAAGGLGFAFLLLGATLRSGASIVAEAIGLEEKIKHSQWVITGEGQSDFQSLFGKVPFYVAQLSKRFGKRAILLSGSLGEGHEKLYDHFSCCYSIISKPMILEDAIENVDSLLFDAAWNIACLIEASKPIGAND